MPMFKMEHVPLLAEVEPVWAQDTPLTSENREVRAYLRAVRLEAYQDVAGNCWIGRSDDEVAEHERWIYVIPRQQLEAASAWNRRNYGTMEECDGSYHMYNRLDFIDELKELAQLMDDALYAIKREEGPMDASEEDRLRRKLALMRRNCTYINTRDMISMIKAPWDTNMHEVMFHYESWCANHAAEGYPRELALRMHGLGSYLTASAGGWKWFKHILAGKLS